MLVAWGAGHTVREGSARMAFHVQGAGQLLKPVGDIAL